MDANAHLVRKLTVQLNGHCYDVTQWPGWKGPKSSYFQDGGGAWAERRKRRFLARPGGVHPRVYEPRDIDGSRIDLAAIMRWEPYDPRLGEDSDESIDVAPGGRKLDWTGSKRVGGGFDKAGRLKTGGHEDAGEVKWKDQGHPEAADALGADGPKGYSVVSKSGLAGGQHDEVQLLYDKFSNGTELGRLREALTGRGRTPPQRQGDKEEAERIICELTKAGISKAEQARLFDCNRKTIGRVLKRRGIVPLLPYGGKHRKRAMTPPFLFEP